MARAVVEQPAIITNLANVYDHYASLRSPKEKKAFLNNNWITQTGERKVKTLGDRFLAAFWFTRKSFKQENDISYKNTETNLLNAIDRNDNSQFVKAVKSVAIFEAFKAAEYGGGNRKAQKLISVLLGTNLPNVIPFLNIIDHARNTQEARQLEIGKQQVRAIFKDLTDETKQISQSFRSRQKITATSFEKLSHLNLD